VVGEYVLDPCQIFLTTICHYFHRQVSLSPLATCAGCIICKNPLFVPHVSSQRQRPIDDESEPCYRDTIGNFLLLWDQTAKACINVEIIPIALAVDFAITLSDTSNFAPRVTLENVQNALLHPRGIP
jgi:hypothetical protein